MMWGRKGKDDGAPKELRLVDGAMALDGGSTGLRCLADGKSITLNLDWSGEDQAKGTTRFSADGRTIPKRSPEEAAWMALLRTAAARLPAFDPDRPMQRKGFFLLPPEDLAYFKAMEQGPDVALRVLAERFANLVESETHVRKVLGADESLRAMIREGRRFEAVQAYREAHPGATLAEARAAIEKMAAEEA